MACVLFGALRSTTAFSVSPAMTAATRSLARKSHLSSRLYSVEQQQQGVGGEGGRVVERLQPPEEVDPGKVEGTDLRILKYPHPALRAFNAPVTPEELNDGSIVKIAKEMLLLMYAAEGVGLAAPQVGINKRLMVFNESGDKQKWLTETVLVNPVIVDYGPTTDLHIEGCLSFPGMGGDVERSKWIKVEALTTKGKKIKKKYSGWEARVFQHEYDHLDGKVYIDRLSEEDRKQVQPVLDQLIQEFGSGGVL
ncbi:peptide deformylase [Fragilaria crotonensis]|nr:peptide deformylase [Fragilaria crotonensis]